MKRNKLSYIVLVIFCIFVGSALMYGLIYFFPTKIVKSVKKEEVTVSETGISKSVKKVYNSVIYVKTNANNTGSMGSGFVYKKGEKKAYIITNYHVVNGANEIEITYFDDSTAKATLVGGDEYSDIAILTVDASTVKQVVTTGDNSKMEVGDTVFAVGAPLGLDYKGTVTRGILSGKDRLVDVSLGNTMSSDWVMNVMQTDASINPGNSGGPLCNVNGEVIGVTSMKIVQTEAEGLGFAIPIEDAMSYAEQIEKNKEVKRPYLGVELVNVNQIGSLMYRGIEINTDLTEGAVIAGIQKDSPASEAGIKSGDVITKINNYEIESVARFRYYLYKYNPGDKIKVTVNRNGKDKTMTVKLKESKS